MGTTKRLLELDTHTLKTIKHIQRVESNRRGYHVTQKMVLTEALHWFVKMHECIGDYALMLEIMQKFVETDEGG